MRNSLLASLCLVLGCTVSGRIDDGSSGSTSKDAGHTDAGSVESCQSAADCHTAGAAVCDVAQHRCVQCLTDGQCPTSETCKHDLLCHGTVECRSDDDCSPAFHCGTERTCVVTPGRCMADNDCLDPAAKKCDSESLTCVACLTALDCGTDGLAQCSASHTCQLTEGRCRAESDCAGNSSAPHCDTGSHSCVACTQNSQCDSNQCYENTCAQLGTCVDDNSCVHVSGKPKCNTDSNQCVACLVNNDCPNNGICSNQTCLAAGTCTSDNDCASVSGRPRCVSSQCVACRTTSDCGGNACVNNVCQAAGYCTGESDCTSRTSTPHCNVSAHQCVECVNTNQCQSGETCSANTCQLLCSYDWDCPNSAQPHCLTSTGACVQCTSNSHCASGQTCTNNTCQGTSTGTSCGTILDCRAACTTQACGTNCYNAGSPAARAYFDALISCVFDVQCPDMTTDGVCNQSSPNYNRTNCTTCIDNAVATGAPCGSAYDDCANN